jgi:hypothetical protein
MPSRRLASFAALLAAMLTMASAQDEGGLMPRTPLPDGPTSSHHSFFSLMNEHDRVNADDKASAGQMQIVRMNGTVTNTADTYFISAGAETNKIARSDALASEAIQPRTLAADITSANASAAHTIAVNKTAGGSTVTEAPAIKSNYTLEADGKETVEAGKNESAGTTVSTLPVAATSATVIPTSAAKDQDSILKASSFSVVKYAALGGGLAVIVGATIITWCVVQHTKRTGQPA